MIRNAPAKNANSPGAKDSEWEDFAAGALALALILFALLLACQAHGVYWYVTNPANPLRHEGLIALGLLGFYGSPIWLASLWLARRAWVPKYVPRSVDGCVVLSVLAFIFALVA